MSRRTTTSVVAALAALGLAGTLGAAPAQAKGGERPPPWTFLPPGPPVSAAAGELCDFPLTVTDVVNQEYSKELRNGDTLITGRLVVRITNDATGESVLRNISGPGKDTTGPNGEQLTTVFGPALLAVFPGDDATGRYQPGLYYTRGPLVFTDGLLTRAPSRSEDLCATLG